MKKLIFFLILVLIIGTITIFISADICENQRQKYFETGINYTGKQVYDIIKAKGSVSLKVGSETIILVELKNDKESS